MCILLLLCYPEQMFHVEHFIFYVLRRMTRPLRVELSKTLTLFDSGAGNMFTGIERAYAYVRIRSELLLLPALIRWEVLLCYCLLCGHVAFAP